MRPGLSPGLPSELVCDSPWQLLGSLVSKYSCQAVVFVFDFIFVLFLLLGLFWFFFVVFFFSGCHVQWCVLYFSMLNIANDCKSNPDEYSFMLFKSDFRI